MSSQAPRVSHLAVCWAEHEQNKQVFDPLGTRWALKRLFFSRVIDAASACHPHPLTPPLSLHLPGHMAPQLEAYISQPLLQLGHGIISLPKECELQ